MVRLCNQVHQRAPEYQVLCMMYQSNIMKPNSNSDNAHSFTAAKMQDRYTAVYPNE